MKQYLMAYCRGCDDITLYFDEDDLKSGFECLFGNRKLVLLGITTEEEK